MIESSYNSFLAGHQILVQKRRRFQIDRRFASTYRESLTIRMSTSTDSSDTIISETPEPLPGIAEAIVQRQPSSTSGASGRVGGPTKIPKMIRGDQRKSAERKLERRNSRESSEGDLVHVSEVSSMNNGNSPPHSGEATPISSENQQVDLKFERRDSQDKSSSAVVSKPHLAPKQRRDVKETGYDDVEESIQLVNACMLTRKQELGDKEKKHQLKVTVQTAAGIALTAALIGTYVYFKYR